MPRTPRNWKINCTENWYPGLWHTWYRRQVAAVGWPRALGYHLEGRGRMTSGWNIARSYLQEVRPGDRVVVALPDSRVGRIGEVVRVSIGDDDWDQTVPQGPGLPHGEMGRLLHVRWDLETGPAGPAMVVRLPPEARLSGGKLRLTMCELDTKTLRQIERAMKDEHNWESILPTFDHEKSLSDYIVNSPERLEDGLRPYPSKKAREMVFKDRSRLDVLLLDRSNNAVVVECKLGAPRPEDVKQLRGYMRNAAKLRRVDGKRGRVRGILVHGGSRKLPDAVRREGHRKPVVELVQYAMTVSFARST